MWVQVTGRLGSFESVSCAGSTKVLTATNQDVAVQVLQARQPSPNARYARAYGVYRFSASNSA
jgi:hypothetical protein